MAKHFPTTIVQQLTPFTCGLACIESVCKDFGKMKKQEDFLREFKKEMLNDISDIGHFGATSVQLMCHILNKLDFTVRLWKDHRPEIQQEHFEIADLSKEAIIIAANFALTSNHSVRFSGMKENDVIYAMDPSFAGSGISEFSLTDLIKWNYSFIKIS